MHLKNRYDLVLGVATADSLVFGLSDKQLEYGVELEGRNQILSEFVAANYELHQREIFSAIVTEYTDWQSPTQHPASIRDKTLEALNDAQYVAPLVEVTLFYFLQFLFSNFNNGCINKCQDYDMSTMFWFVYEPPHILAFGKVQHIHTKTRVYTSSFFLYV